MAVAKKQQQVAGLKTGAIAVDEATLVDDEEEDEEQQDQKQQEDEKPQPPEAVLYHRSPNPGLVGQNGAVRQVAGIMQQGARYAKSAFPAHTILFAKLRDAIDRRDETAFLDALSAYLSEAEGHLPHAARKEDVPILTGGIRLLVGELALGGHDGLFLVGRYLLSAASSVTDFF